jgi:hypothetical protein
LADSEFWTAVLDDLESRLAAAETGRIEALSGWTMPPAPPRRMDALEQARATGILARQQSLMTVLAASKAKAGAALSSMRRPRFKVEVAPPVYVDRSF